MKNGLWVVEPSTLSVPNSSLPNSARFMLKNAPSAVVNVGFVGSISPPGPSRLGSTIRSSSRSSSTSLSIRRLAAMSAEAAACSVPWQPESTQDM